MTNLKLPPAYDNFINKILQLQQALYRDKKQKQMQAEQQLLSNEDLHKMSVQLLKETLDLDQFEFQQFQEDIKFESYVRSIQKIGMVLSKFYQERINDRDNEIQSLKVQNKDFQYKLTQQMELNQFLHDEIQNYQNSQAQFYEKLDKSEHEIEHKKHQIQNEINANEFLLKENDKLKTGNDQLIQQNTNLKLEIQELIKKNQDLILKNQQLQQQKKYHEEEIKKLIKEYDELKQNHYFLEKDLEVAYVMIDQKDYIIANQNFQEVDPQQLSAHHPFSYLNSTVRAVKQENQQVGSDKDVMKNIESRGLKQPRIALKFNESRSISRDSEKSQTSLYIIEHNMLDDIVQQDTETPEHYNNKKLLKTDRRRKDSDLSLKQPQNKSCNKMQPKKKDQSIPKVPFPNPSPKLNQKQKEIPITEKKKIELDEKMKLDLENIRNASEQNHTKIKNRKLRSNASVILKNPVSRLFGDEQKIVKKSKIQHSQSVEDFYRDDTSQYMEKDQIERELYTKQKLIESLKLENRSVRQMVFEEQQKRTQAEHEYEQSIEKLRSEVDYFKTQMRETYVKYVQQKAFSDALQKQLIEVSELVQKKQEEYEHAKKELKIKCKQLIEDEIRYYQARYEEIQEKMKIMQYKYLNSKKDLDYIGDDIQDEQNSKRLKKCKSNSLFYKQVKGHSYNTSQQYSEINNFSANHSKNTSFIHIDQEEYVDSKYGDSNILIQDFGENQMEQVEQNYEELQSYQKENQFCDREIQTDFIFTEEDSYKMSLQYSKMQEANDSSEISYQFSSLGLKSSEDHSKIRLSLQDKVQKAKKLSICPIESIIIEPEKMGVSDFDTLYEISPRTINESSCLTADISCQFSKLKLNLNLVIQKAFSLVVNESKLKIDRNTETFKPSYSFVKSESIKVIPFEAKKEYSLLQTVSEWVLAENKIYKDMEVQNEKSFFSSFSTQTSLTEVESIQIQSTPELQSFESQTERYSLRHTQILSICFLPTKRQTLEFGTQQKNDSSEFSTQTFSKQLHHISQFSSTFIPEVKKLESTSIQTSEFNLNIENTIFNQTIFPSEDTKIDHNQSFNEEHIDSVLANMSQSFEISDTFIETLKKKLLQINENLKKLQQEKQDDSSISSNGVQKIFNSIDMGTIINHDKILSVETIPKYRAECFEGNVQTSKASTSCSVSTSLSFQSPNRHETEEGKMRVKHFQEILEIESENVDSFTRTQAENLQSYQYEKFSCAGSVNKSPEQQNILSEAAQIANFLTFHENQDKGGSGKKYENSNKKLSNLLNSPKIHLIQKQKVSSPVNSPKNKLVRQKTGAFEKPKQLGEISHEDFDFICKKFKAKRMKLIERRKNQMKNESTEFSTQSMYHNLSSRELMIIFCKQIFYKDTTTANHEIIILHQSRVLSLTYNYEFQAQRIVVSTSGDRLILGNQEVTLTESQLKFWLNNKMNHFVCNFPSGMNHQVMESIKSKEFQVLKLFKYKFK